MRSSSRPARGCITRALWIYTLFVLVTVSLAVASGYVLAWRWWRAEDAAWTDAGLSMDAFGARYPARPDNAAAVRLDALSRLVGIPSLMDYGKGEHQRWDVNKEPLKTWGIYLNKVASEPHDRRKPATPDGLQEFLRVNAAVIDSIEDHLLTGGSIEWKQDLSRGIEAPIPYLLGMRRLQEILLLRALDAHARGQHIAAARSLEAAWAHSASVSERPEMLSQLMTSVHADVQNGLLRRLEAPSAEWPDRLAKRDFTARALRAYQAEAYTWRAMARQNRGMADLEAGEKGLSGGSIGGRVFRFMTVPYIRISFAGANEYMRRAMQVIERQDLCTLDGDEAKKTAKTAFPRWNIVGRLAVPDLLPLWSVVRDRVLDDELTLRVLEARAHRRATGAWPSGFVPSTACADMRWAYRPAPGGALSIEPEPEPELSKRHVWPFVVSPS
jgi:hypothetical protein